VAELLALPKNKVIWVNQEGPQPASPFVTLHYFSEIAEAMAEHLPTATEGEIDLRTPTAFTLEVQYFGKKKSFPVDVLYDFVRQLERPTIIDKFAIAGVAFVYAESVQDVSALMGNEQQVEARAAVDLHLRYTASVIDNPGVIEHLSGITGTVINGKLIYGHIAADGTVTDVSNSVPIDITTNM
jgi:hypothetical protein